MGLFDGLFRSRDKPENRTAGSGYTFFFGGTSALNVWQLPSPSTNRGALPPYFGSSSNQPVAVERSLAAKS